MAREIETGATGGYKAPYPIWDTPLRAVRSQGLEPAPERVRKTTWKEFLQRHWGLIVAADFFTVEVWTRRGLQRFLVLFFIELSTRRVRVASIARQANGLWMSQVNRLIAPEVCPLMSDGPVQRRKRLGGLLNYYYRAA